MVSTLTLELSGQDIRTRVTKEDTVYNVQYTKRRHFWYGQLLTVRFGKATISKLRSQSLIYNEGSDDASLKDTSCVALVFANISSPSPVSEDVDVFWLLQSESVVKGATGITLIVSLFVSLGLFCML